MSAAQAIPTHRNFKDLTGKKFGRLLVISYAGKNYEKRSVWNCTCNCGNKRIVRTSCLTNGHTESCGCISLDRASTLHLTHGMTKVPEYQSWKRMKRRCFDPKIWSFKYYGGRGITVAKEWADSFETFFAYVGPKPSPGHSIDRIDNNGNYEPGNVRWATKTEQAQNTRSIRIITFNGISMPVPAWEDKLGFTRGTIRQRLNRNGWSIEEAMTTSVVREP